MLHLLYTCRKGQFVGGTRNIIYMYTAHPSHKWIWTLTSWLVRVDQQKAKTNGKWEENLVRFYSVTLTETKKLRCRIGLLSRPWAKIRQLAKQALKLLLGCLAGKLDLQRPETTSPVLTFSHFLKMQHRNLICGNNRDPLRIPLSPTSKHFNKRVA